MGTCRILDSKLVLIKKGSLMSTNLLSNGLFLGMWPRMQLIFHRMNHYLLPGFMLFPLNQHRLGVGFWPVQLLLQGNRWQSLLDSHNTDGTTVQWSVVDVTDLHWTSKSHAFLLHYCVTMPIGRMLLFWLHGPIFLSPHFPHYYVSAFPELTHSKYSGLKSPSPPITK